MGFQPKVLPYAYEIKTIDFGGIAGAEIQLLSVFPEGNVVRHYVVGVVELGGLVHMFQRIFVNVIVRINEHKVTAAGFFHSVISRTAESTVFNRECAN